VVDIASGWWEGQAIAVRSQQETKSGLEQMRPRFPFALKEIHPDNDSAMLNDLPWDWCRTAKIRMSRSRPYKKNDNAWVEQKNWTHVRKVVGYRRYDSSTELQLLNEILHGSASVPKLLSASHQAARQDARGWPDQTEVRESPHAL
jgi:hypothetical protein